MEKFVVIKTTAADLKKRPKHLKNVHPDYPLDVAEFETLSEAQQAHPNKIIYTPETYSIYKNAMNEVHGKLSEPHHKRPWWKFWA